MKKLLCTALLSTLLISCHATARLYPVQGPLAAQTPALEQAQVPDVKHVKSAEGDDASHGYCTPIMCRPGEPA